MEGASQNDAKPEEARAAGREPVDRSNCLKHRGRLRISRRHRPTRSKVQSHFLHDLLAAGRPTIGFHNLCNLNGRGGGHAPASLKQIRGLKIAWMGSSSWIKHLALCDIRPQRRTRRQQFISFVFKCFHNMIIDLGITDAGRRRR